MSDTNLGRFSRIVRDAWEANVWPAFRKRWRTLTKGGMDPIAAAEQALSEAKADKDRAELPVTVSDREGKA